MDIVRRKLMLVTIGTYRVKVPLKTVFTQVVLTRDLRTLFLDSHVNAPSFFK